MLKPFTFENPPSDLYFGSPRPFRIPEIFAPNFLQTEQHEIICSYSLDHTVFTLTRSSLNFQQQELWITFYKEGHWSTPKRLIFPPYKNVSNGVFSTFDNHLYFRATIEINSPTPTKYHEIMRAPLILETHEFDSPLRIPMINSVEGHSGFPTFAANGNLYFHSNRPENIGAVDLYRSEYRNGKYMPPENLGEPINAPNKHIFHPFIDPQERFILFDSPDCEPDQTNQNLFISYRNTDGTWQKAHEIGPNIKSEVFDLRPHISPDEKYLFFTSARPVSVEKSSLPMNQNIYWVSTDGLINF